MTKYLIYAETTSKYIVELEAKSLEEAADMYYNMPTDELNTYISDTDGGIEYIDVDGETFYPDHRTGKGFHK